MECFLSIVMCFVSIAAGRVVVQKDSRELQNVSFLIDLHKISFEWMVFMTI